MNPQTGGDAAQGGLNPMQQMLSGAMARVAMSGAKSALTPSPMSDNLELRVLLSSPAVRAALGKPALRLLCGGLLPHWSPTADLLVPTLCLRLPGPLGSQDVALLRALRIATEQGDVRAARAALRLCAASTALATLSRAAAEGGDNDNDAPLDAGVLADAFADARASIEAMSRAPFGPDDLEEAVGSVAALAHGSGRDLSDRGTREFYAGARPSDGFIRATASFAALAHALLTSLAPFINRPIHPLAMASHMDRLTGATHHRASAVGRARMAAVLQLSPLAHVISAGCERQRAVVECALDAAVCLWWITDARRFWEPPAPPPQEQQQQQPPLERRGESSSGNGNGNSSAAAAAKDDDKEAPTPTPPPHPLQAQLGPVRTALIELMVIVAAGSLSTLLPTRPHYYADPVAPAFAAIGAGEVATPLSERLRLRTAAAAFAQSSRTNHALLYALSSRTLYEPVAAWIPREYAAIAAGTLFFVLRLEGGGGGSVSGNNSSTSSSSNNNNIDNNNNNINNRSSNANNSSNVDDASAAAVAVAVLAHLVGGREFADGFEMPALKPAVETPQDHPFDQRFRANMCACLAARQLGNSGVGGGGCGADLLPLANLLPPKLLRRAVAALTAAACSRLPPSFEHSLSSPAIAAALPPADCLALAQASVSSLDARSLWLRMDKRLSAAVKAGALPLAPAHVARRADDSPEARAVLEESWNKFKNAPRLLALYFTWGEDALDLSRAAVVLAASPAVSREERLAANRARAVSEGASALLHRMIVAAPDAAGDAALPIYELTQFSVILDPRLDALISHHALLELSPGEILLREACAADPRGALATRSRALLALYDDWKRSSSVGSGDRAIALRRLRQALDPLGGVQDLLSLARYGLHIRGAQLAGNTKKGGAAAADVLGGGQGAFRARKIRCSAAGCVTHQQAGAAKKRRCGRCLTSYFCSAACLKAAAEHHPLLCGVLKEARQKAGM